MAIVTREKEFLSHKANLTTPLSQGYHAIKKIKYAILLHLEGVLHD
jgi:hypothetical protein